MTEEIINPINTKRDFFFIEADLIDLNAQPIGLIAMEAELSDNPWWLHCI